MEQVIFCHRFSRKDSFLSKPLVDYSILRDPMYKYSKIALANFFKVTNLVFILGWFCKSEKARAFLNERASNASQNIDFGGKLTEEANKMYQLALKSLGSNKNLLF